MKNFFLILMLLWFGNSYAIASCLDLDTKDTTSKNRAIITGLNGATDNVTTCIVGDSKNDNADYYKFKVQENGYLNITTSSPNNHKYHLKIGTKDDGSKYYGDKIAKQHDIDEIYLANGDEVYVYIKETGSDTDKYKINFNFTKEEQTDDIPVEFKGGMCYAIDDTQNKLYTVNMAPGADRLPSAKSISLDFRNLNGVKFDGEGGAFHSKDGLLYEFDQGDKPKLYSINPKNGEVRYIKTFNQDHKKIEPNIVGEAFYGGYFYILAQDKETSDTTLYKIDVDDWNIKAIHALSGDVNHASAIAINKDGVAYITMDNDYDGVGKIFIIDLKTAKTTYTGIRVKKSDKGTTIESEGLSFASDGNLYIEDVESRRHYSQRLYKVDLSNGDVLSSAKIVNEGTDDHKWVDIEGLSCNVVVPQESDDSSDDELEEPILIADYHFDECSWSGEDDEVKDSSGHGFDGIAINGATTDKQGQINRSGRFTEATDAVKVEEIKGLDSKNFSVSFWTKINDIDSSHNTVHDLLKLGSKHSDSAGNNSLLKISYIDDSLVDNDNKHLRIKSLFKKKYSRGYQEYTRVPDVNLNDGNWHHIVTTYSDKKMKIYVDNKNIYEESLKKTSSNHIDGVLDDFSGLLELGSSSDDDTKANIDEVKLYSGALSSDEIATIHNNEKVHKNADGSQREEIVCGTPFVCQESTLLFSNQTKIGTGEGDESSMWLHSINKEKSPFSFTPIGNAYDKTYNALAYNPKDNFLYATYKNNLLKIDKNATVTDLGDIEGMEDIQYYSGVIDRDGYYYVGNWNEQKRDEIYKIDLKKRKVIKTIKLTYDGNRKTLWYVDLAISSDDKYFYLINGKTIQDPDMKYPTQLAKVDKESGEVTFIGDKIYEHLAEAVFADKNNKLYALYHEGGFYEIDTTTGERIPISTAPITSDLQDGANCPESVIVIDKPEIFECNQNSYIFSSDKNDEYSKSDIIDLVRGEVITEKESFGDYHINAIGFNSLDGFIYGWQSDEGTGDYNRLNAHLVKVDSNYNVFDVYLNKQIPDSKQRYILGDVSKDGIYYMANMGGDNDHGYYLHKIRVVDLNKTEFVKDIDIKYPHSYTDNKYEHIKNADFAINPIDDQLYMINSNNNQLIRVKISGDQAGTFEELGEVYKMNPNFDIENGKHANTYSVFSFFDKNGIFYFQIGKSVYKIDISEPWSGKNDTKSKAKIFTSTTLNKSGDGARCALTDMGALPIIELSIKDTKEGNNGLSDINITFLSDRVIDKDITLKYSTSKIENIKNSATIGTDFLEDFKTIVIPKGSTTISIPLVKGDIEVERDEVFDIKLESDDVLFLDSVDGVREDIILEAKILDDDFSKFTAYDIDDTHNNISDKKIKTKVVGEQFSLTLTNINPNDANDVNRTTTRVRIVEHDKCDNEDTSGEFEEFTLPEDGYSVDHNFTIPKAIKIASVQFVWKDTREDRLRTSCSSDMFAIRPKTFSFGSGMSIYKAGEDINLSILAGIDDSASYDYNESIDTSFKVDIKQKQGCDLNISQDLEADFSRFTNGELNTTLIYKDVGKLNISISEIDGHEFAIVDKDDTLEDDRFIQKAHREISFIPDHFDVNSTFINNSTHDKSYAFYTKNDLVNSPKWLIGTKAVNKGGYITKNYNSECVANDIELFTDIDINTTASSFTLMYAEDNATYFTPNQDQSRTLTIAKSSFISGVADKNITINFSRNKLIAQVPATITFKKVKAVDGNTTGEDTPNEAITYKYMRAYIQSPIEVIGSKELNTTVYYEAYDPSSSTGKRSVSGDRGWKRVNFDDTSGKMRFENLQVSYGGRVTLTNEGNQTLNVIAQNIPEKNRVKMGLDEDFRYITDTISTDISFTPDSANWAGDGGLGMMVDTNVSRRTKFKRMDW